MEYWKRNKSKINLVIDAIMFVVIMAVAGLGFLMKYVLLPGYKINEIYGTDTELFFWGLDRHQWGTIHLWLALFLVFLLALHIILHWDMIVSIFKQMISVKATRYIIGISLGVIALFLSLAPLNVKPEISQLERKHNRNRVPERSATVPADFQSTTNLSESEPAEEPALSQEDRLQAKSQTGVHETADTEVDELHRHHRDQIDIDGTMTLSEISARYNIPVEKLAEAINVPVDYSNEKLGRLKKLYIFEIDALRVYVLNESPKDTD